MVEFAPGRGEVVRGARMSGVRESAERWGKGLNRAVEWVCAGLMVALVLVTWLGIVSRYTVDLGITWTEETARYLMIWVALLAVSSGVARGEHVSVEFLFNALPRPIAIVVFWLFEASAIAFFGVLLAHGVSMTSGGATQYASMFGMTMVLPYAAVPVSSALAIIQLVLKSVSRGARPAGGAT